MGNDNNHRGSRNVKAADGPGLAKSKAKSKIKTAQAIVQKSLSWYLYREERDEPI